MGLQKKLFLTLRPRLITRTMLFCIVLTAMLSLSTMTIGTTTKYHFIQSALSFTDAQNYCHSQFGTDLASVHGRIEYEDIISAIPSEHTYFVWLGLNRIYTQNEQTWQWTDESDWNWGTDVSGGIYPWNDDEPNNSRGNQQCVGLILSEEWLWTDRNCANLNYFLCNFYPKSPANIDITQCVIAALIIGFIICICCCFHCTRNNNGDDHQRVPVSPPYALQCKSCSSDIYGDGADINEITDSIAVKKGLIKKNGSDSSSSDEVSKEEGSKVDGTTLV